MKIKVKLKPNSKKESIDKIKEDEYTIYVKDSPIDNKANIALVKLLQRYFKKEVKIVSGLKSRKKLIELK